MRFPFCEPRFTRGPSRPRSDDTPSRRRRITVPRAQKNGTAPESQSAVPCLVLLAGFSRDGASCRFYSSRALNAWSRSQMMSSAFSVPMERRMVDGVMPWSASSSSVSWLCVVVAG